MAESVKPPIADPPDPRSLPLFDGPPIGHPPGATPGATPSDPRTAPLDTPPATALDRPLGNRAPTDEPARATSVTSRAVSPDWTLVRALREQASITLATALAESPNTAEDDRRELARAIVGDLVREKVAADTFRGRRTLDQADRAGLTAAVLDALFGLGRLQPLVDDPTIENIEITGFDTVVIERTDGTLDRGSPIAGSDAELLDFLQFLAARRPDAAERPFSSASPRLHLNLPGSRARLAALAWVSHRPIVRIRKHGLTDVTLDDLVELGTLDRTLSSFLAAAVAARASIVISGSMGAGKTTLLRALARTLPPMEAIATLETEYELFLHEGGHHHRVIALEARPGSGERTADGRPAGEITVEDLFVDVLRLNVSRIIVGEVRGGEAAAMFKAMQAGAGSLSTIHAKTAADTIERLALAVHSTGGSESYADRLVAAHIDFIVHVSLHIDPITGDRGRVVDEVIEVTRGEAGRPAINDVFVPGPTGVAIAQTAPARLPQLVAAGFDPSPFHHGPMWRRGAHGIGAAP